MGNIMAAGIFIPLIACFLFADDSFWNFLVLLIYAIWIWIFGGYINRMLDQINRDYPKENSNGDINEKSGL